MSRIFILCVDDEPDVLEVVIRDLEGIEDVFPLETAGSAAEARELIQRLQDGGDLLGVILCDHVMPGENGVDLLVAMEGDAFTSATRRVLLTGQAGLDATVRAVNHASLAHFIAKPWDSAELRGVVRQQMTQFILNQGIDYQPYLRALDPMLIGKALHEGLGSDR